MRFFVTNISKFIIKFSMLLKQHLVADNAAGCNYKQGLCIVIGSVRGTITRAM